MIHVRNFIRNRNVKVRRRPLTADVGVQSPMILCKIPGEPSGIGAGVLLGFFGFPLIIIIPSLFHTQL